jgi:nucleoside-diphosphate-sugar epimerase
LVPSLVWSLLEDESVSVATKKPIRDFVFVADVIDAVLRLMESDFSGPINVGSGIGASVEEVCDILEGVSGRKIGDRGLSGTGHAEYRHDLSLLESIIGQYDPVRISEGLAATYLQMKEFHEQAD